jgi:hypothetical protein
MRPVELWNPTNLLFNRYRSYFPGIKRLGHEVNHITPWSAGVKNELYLSSL